MEPGFLTLAFGLVFIGGCSARVVTVSPGPLIRVEGQPVSIRCDVNDYGGPSEQDFDWEMSRDETGPKSRIISTFESDFSDPLFSRRVASGDISVVRLQDNEAELKIAEVKLTDAGFYLCRTPSTDPTTSGNYYAQVQLRVIPNTLKVSPQVPSPVVQEGHDLTLSCSVTRELAFPSLTYLSVAWLVKTGGGSEEILTFGPQRDVVTGQRFARRYLDGDLRLVPGRNGTFELVISRVTASDEGTYVCTGSEWTRESGGKWTKIVESSKEMGAVSVTPTNRSLNVKASSSPSSQSSSSLLLSPGNTLTLLCRVSADNLRALSLEVTWLADDREIITVNRSGVVSTNAASKRGEASLEKTGDGDYRLAVRDVSGRDGGIYTCRVQAFIEEGRITGGGAGRGHKVAEKTSNPVTVKVTEIKPNFTLTLEATMKPQKTGEPIELSCDVTNIFQLPPGGRLGVRWEHIGLLDKGTNAPPPKLIGSLDAHGNLESNSAYKDRLDSGVLGLSRARPNKFKLRFLHTQKIDMGHYVCAVSAWSVSSQGEVVQVAEYKSSPLTVQWDTKSPTLNVAAKTIRHASVGGATFEMSCSAVTKNIGDWIGFAVYIQSQGGIEGSVKTIMSLSPDNVVQITDLSRSDNLVLSKTGSGEFHFRLEGVQVSDKGYYWCNVTAFTKQQPDQSWTTVATSESNKVSINFQENGPSFSVKIHSDASSVYPWETAKMECSVGVSGSSPKSANSQTEELAYEVRWFFTRLRGGPTTSPVVSVDRFGVATKSIRNSSSDVSIERKDPSTYVLNIFGTQDSDSGEYHCMVTPWYKSASSGLWTQDRDYTSGKVFLSVKFAVWDSLKLPLLYGASASLGVGVFSLLLGLICARCCCRNTAHTPRSRSKLMDLEMD
ncbi:prostaglandin F2 receptor negative regulator [Poeciliopsis prolifica]|uniref:prostaglandin F2 receptor negative regulator n=1 Tax=Poeciliopsis prolifica TaxID=188132 RepID=UPI0024140DF6|nr:prostaglandin F2 receptor negative regulator [Poeciliopsis prolifica]